MRQIAIISGKGGTGKTSMTAAFAQLAQRCVIADCDVDAANLHLIVKAKPDSHPPEAFKSGYRASIDLHHCQDCNACISACRFDAIHKDDHGQVAIHDLFCEGCGLCVDVCPGNLISLKEKIVGELLLSQTPYGPLVHGKLGIAQSASGKLVTLVRKRAEEIASQNQSELILIDGSPGIGCPVIASLSGVDAAVVVTEPTVSGKHDMMRVLELCKHFGVKTFLVINKWDLNPELSDELTALGKSMETELLGRIGFNPLFPKALAQGETILEYAADSSATVELAALWTALSKKPHLMG